MEDPCCPKGAYQALLLELEADSMIRILLIPSSDYLGHPFPQRHNQIFERIHDGKNFEVHVVRFNIFGSAKLSSKCIIHEFPLEFNMSRTSVYYLSNAMNHLKWILNIIKRETIDVVIAGNLLPPFLLELCKGVSRLKIPFIFDLQDYYPTSAAGYICDVRSLFGAIIRGVFESMTQALLRMADAVTVPGFALAIYARDIRKRLDRERVYIIPNGISEHFLKLHDRTRMRKKLGYDDEDFVVGYVGSIEFWLDMKTLIKALSKARQEGLRIKFMLVGGRLQTTYAENVMKWIKHEGIEHITDWVGFVKYEDVPEYIAAMDVGTIPFDVRNLTAYYAAPNKLWEYLSQRVSVVSTPIPEALAHKTLLNIVASEDECVTVLKRIKKERENDLENQGKNEIMRHLKRRTWSASAEKIKEVIREVVYNK
jgi:glycosyltransferase involved in cell wall biosynthesis